MEDAMSRELKQINELKDGECKVIAVNTHGREIEFEGTFNSKLRTVFYVIPSDYKILGYIQ